MPSSLTLLISCLALAGAGLATVLALLIGSAEPDH